MTECLVCFCDIEGDSYGCADPKCHGETCDECIDSLINFSAENERIPTCIRSECNSYYTLSSLKGVPKETILKYNQSCLNFFLKDQGDLVQKKIEEEKILAKLRAERTQFINQEYPAAIALVASLTFKSKLRHLERQKSKLISKQLNSANRSCMLSTCNGFLDKNMVCLTCSTEFCQRCEVKLIPNQPHQCKQEDLDSVNIVNDMVRCPKCKLPVFKDVGCDSITCSNCNTNFLYSTGKIGGHGSSNAKIKVNLNERKRISIAFRQKIPSSCMENILLIEASEPKPKSKDSLLVPIKDYYQNGNQGKSGAKLARLFNVYLAKKYECRDYYTKIVELEKVILNDSDNLEEEIKEIVDQFDF